MGRRSEQTFFQRRDTDGQEVYEKVLNIPNHQQNVNQNHNEVSPHTCQNGYYQKDKKNKVTARMWKKGNLCVLLGGVWSDVVTMENSMRFLKKLTTELPYHPAIPLLGIYPKKTKTLIWKDICTSMFTAALFTIPRTWKQSKCPLIGEWIKKFWDRKTDIHTYTQLVFSHKKRMKSCHFNTMDVPWGHYAKWKIKKKQIHMISLICGI